MAPSPRTQPRKIVVLGLGYIGLPTASLLATKGFEVVGVDVNPGVVSSIQRGELHIEEPDLDILVRSARQSERLRASLQPEAADIFILCVPTPFRDGYQPDLTFVEQATRSIAPHVREGNLVILESTSPVGTTERVSEWIEQERPDLKSQGRRKVHFAHCPERVLPGQILKELVENDRVVGGIDAGSTAAAKAFYESFVSGQVIATDCRTAELTKLAENSFRDTNIAFANELAEVCERLKIDVWELISLANRHPRVNILKPGPGVGGHCIAVDPWFIVASAPEQTPLIQTSRKVNSARPKKIADQARKLVSDFPSPTVAILGLSYKANIDDLRESPAVEVAEALAAENQIRLLVVEPHISELPKSLCLPGIELTDLRTALDRCQVAVLLVDHRDFRRIEPDWLGEKPLLDTRGMFSHRNAKSPG